MFFSIDARCYGLHMDKLREIEREIRLPVDMWLFAWPIGLEYVGWTAFMIYGSEDQWNMYIYTTGAR